MSIQLGQASCSRWPLPSCILPEFADTDGDDGVEVAETSDDDDKHNVRDLNNLRPRKHYLPL